MKPFLWNLSENTIEGPNIIYFLCSSVQLGEQLAHQVPSSGVDVVELEDEGTCVRFNPLMTAAGKDIVWT